jgi:hypothetical protein
MNTKNYELILLLSAEIKEKSNSFFSSVIKYDTAKDFFSSASYYQKLQNRALKDNDLTLPVYSFSAKNNKDGEVYQYNIKSNKNLNRKQWLMLLICDRHFYLDIDTIRNIINN